MLARHVNGAQDVFCIMVCNTALDSSKQGKQDPERELGEDKILLEGMIFYGRHGTLPTEREFGQRFVVDVEIWCDLRPAGLSDDLSQTVDYSEVHAQIKEIVEGEPVNLTETLAERIAAATLDRHPRVEGVRVKVSKPNVRLGETVLTGSAVELVRRQDTGPGG
jgi:7,8-dihydroneopterin aldolase/epimerase/oxygenase